MTVHLFPTHPRLSEPVPHPRGWVILGAALLIWAAVYGLGFGLLALVGWIV